MGRGAEAGGRATRGVAWRGRAGRTARRCWPCPARAAADQAAPPPRTASRRPGPRRGRLPTPPPEVWRQSGGSLGLDEEVWARLRARLSRPPRPPGRARWRPVAAAAAPPRPPHRPPPPCAVHRPARRATSAQAQHGRGALRRRSDGAEAAPAPPPTVSTSSAYPTTTSVTGSCRHAAAATVFSRPPPRHQLPPQPPPTPSSTDAPAYGDHQIYHLNSDSVEHSPSLDLKHRS